MVETPTVFILGAGASIPYGFPLGSDLQRQAISELSDPRSNVSVILRSCGFRGDEIEMFAKRLLSARTESIDLFLVRNPAYNDLGKHAIAALLMQKEHCLDSPGADIKEDWYSYLFQRMFGTSTDEFTQNRLSIIAFNFERSFEWYLYARLRANFNALDTTAAVGLVKSIPVLHMYGRLGTCAWLGSGTGRRYETPLSVVDVKASAQDIGIIGGDIPPDRLERAKQMLEAADRVCLLGFGYHEFTLKLLLDCGLGKKGEVWGTSFGLLQGEASTPQRMVPSLQLENLRILDFLRIKDFIHAPVRFGKASGTPQCRLIRASRP